MPKKYLIDHEEGRIQPFPLGDNYQQFMEWLNKPNGNFLLTGKPGRKKTYLACKCVTTLLQIGKIGEYDYLFCNVSDLFQEWLSRFSGELSNHEMLKTLQEIKLLILDDLGIKKPSESFLEYLYCIINSRCQDPDLITIYTTNLSAQELDADYGSRIVSRISDGLIIPMQGPDARFERKALNFDQVESKIEKLV